MKGQISTVLKNESTGINLLRHLRNSVCPHGFNSSKDRMSLLICHFVPRTVLQLLLLPQLFQPPDPYFRISIVKKMTFVGRILEFETEI